MSSPRSTARTALEAGLPESVDFDTAPEWFDRLPAPSRRSSAVTRAPQSYAQVLAAFLHRELRRRNRLAAPLAVSQSPGFVVDYFTTAEGGRRAAGKRGDFHVDLLNRYLEHLAECGNEQEACRCIQRLLVKAVEITPSLARAFSDVSNLANSRRWTHHTIAEMLEKIEDKLLPDGDNIRAALYQVSWHPTDARAARNALALLQQLKSVGTSIGVLDDGTLLSHFRTAVRSARSLARLTTDAFGQSVADKVFYDFVTEEKQKVYTTVDLLARALESNQHGCVDLRFAPEEGPPPRRPRAPPPPEEPPTAETNQLSLDDAASEREAAAAQGTGLAGTWQPPTRPRAAEVILNLETLRKHSAALCAADPNVKRFNIDSMEPYNIAHAAGLVGCGDIGWCDVCKNNTNNAQATTTLTIDEFAAQYGGRPTRRGQTNKEGKEITVPSSVVLAHQRLGCRNLYFAIWMLGKRGKISREICEECLKPLTASEAEAQFTASRQRQS